MAKSDLQCAALGIPEHLHRCERPEDQHFDSTEKLFRRHLLADRRIKTAISFNEMSVNRNRYCRSPDEVLINTSKGGWHENYGVVSFSVEAVRALKFSEVVGANQKRIVSAEVRHDIKDEPCNYSHSVVNGAIDGVELKKEQVLSKIARKELRHMLYQSVVTEIPVERRGELLENDSWQ